MKIKVVLSKDVAGLGKANSIVSVTRGYAVNYLIPHKLAYIVSPKHIKKFADRVKNSEEIKKGRAEEQKEILESKKLIFTAKAGENDKLFGSVTSSDISKKIKELFGINIDRKKILLKTPIKKLGEYRILVKLHKDIHANLNVLVNRE